MKFENTEVWGFNHAIRGMRNSINNLNESDSGNEYEEHFGYSLYRYTIGENDLKLAQNLIKAGSKHREFMRQIIVSVDITAPLYWWREFNTYNVGTVSNFCSTMYKLADTPITIDCFEMDDFSDFIHTGKDIVSFSDYRQVDVCNIWKNKVIPILEEFRKLYNETKYECYWKELIRLLPESWLDKRTITMSYENLLVMCSKSRQRFHEFTEWSKSFIDWVRNLPYAHELIFIDEVL